MSLDKFHEVGIRPVAISVDTPEESLDLSKQAGYTFTILSDPNTEAIKRYDLLHAGAGIKGHDVARPAEFLLDGKGTAVGSDLTSGKWLWGNGSVKAITRTIARGVAKPKNHTGVMPPMGGAELSQADLAAVADYVWAIGHRKPY